MGCGQDLSKKATVTNCDSKGSVSDFYLGVDTEGGSKDCKWIRRVVLGPSPKGVQTYQRQHPVRPRIKVPLGSSCVGRGSIILVDSVGKPLFDSGSHSMFLLNEWDLYYSKDEGTIGKKFGKLIADRRNECFPKR